MAELRARFSKSTPERITFEMGFATDHAQRLKLLEEAIDWIAQELTRNRHLKTKHSEDQLTIDIVIALRAMGFQASHDTQYGGHCDIVVEGRDDFLWIAEAKIDTDNGWIMQGFNQLDTRYATCLPGQEAGEMIIYCRRPRVDRIMDAWFEYLSSHRDGIDVEKPNGNSMCGRSSHTHLMTGRQFRVRHTPIALHFAPQDKR